MKKNGLHVKKKNILSEAMKCNLFINYFELKLSHSKELHYEAGVPLILKLRNASKVILDLIRKLS